MCGILFTNNPNVKKGDFINALNLMEHRGPDVSGCYSSFGNIQLGHNRLSIIDLDNRSNQPFNSADKRYSIIFNGEIYNFRELAEKYNIRQKTSGDTEVLIELFAQRGPRMLDELNGMFALCIVDAKTRDIFIARDRLGIKPLYIINKTEGLTVASEIAPLLKLSDKTEFDEIGLRQYRKLRTFFNGRTAFKGISMFPAGHYMLGGKTVRYWRLSEGEQRPPSDEELQWLIKSAVEYRCISDVEVGSYLSGGLDSTIIAALAKKPHTWTVGFPDKNEFKWARKAAEYLKTSHYEIKLHKEEFIELARFMFEKRNEPLSVPNEVLLYKMTKAVKKKNTVILSGEGADELFFGYHRIFQWAFRNKWDIKEFDTRYSYGSNDDLEIIEDVIAPFKSYGSCVNIVAAFFQTAHLHGLLRRLDNSTMICSVEARVPFVDHRLVERMAGVPFEYRMEKGIVKAPLKRIFRDVVPDEIINREKVGFPVPPGYMGFDISPSAKMPMDRWLEFNLKQLQRKFALCIWQ